MLKQVPFENWSRGLTGLISAMLKKWKRPLKQDQSRLGTKKIPTEIYCFSIELLATYNKLIARNLPAVPSLSCLLKSLKMYSVDEIIWFYEKEYSLPTSCG